MPGVDFDDGGSQRRRIRTPGYQAPAPYEPPQTAAPKVPGASPSQGDGVYRPPPIVPESPIAPNVPVGNTGYSTPGAAPAAQQANDGIDHYKTAQVDWNNPNVQQMLARGMSRDYIQRFLYNNPGDYGRIGTAAFGGPDRQASGGSGGGNNVPGSAFSDPVGGPVNDYANERFARLNQPPAGSGQALLEESLRKIASQFEQGGYTPGEMEQFQTQAIDPLERLRTARKQQIMQQLSARGIPPSSGVAQSMLQDADRQFDALRTQQQTQIGTQAAQERQSRMLQSLQLLSGLASTEEGRLDKAFQYRTVPVGLADRAFSQANALYSQANPNQLFGPAFQLALLGQNQQGNQSNALAALADMLMRGGGR